jgi:hypothetical protein
MRRTLQHGFAASGQPLAVSGQLLASLTRGGTRRIFAARKDPDI